MASLFFFDANYVAYRASHSCLDVCYHRPINIATCQLHGTMAEEMGVVV